MNIAMIVLSVVILFFLIIFPLIVSYKAEKKNKKNDLNTTN